MKSSGLKVMAPASLSNLAVGFDILGLALEGPCDEVLAWKKDTKGLSLEAVTGDSGLTPRDPEKNAVSIAAQRLLDHLDAKEQGFSLSLHKKIPYGSGMGGSAASAVAGVMAINELLGKPLEKRELIPFAMQAEKAVSGGWYADNVCASLMGGIILLRDNPSLDLHRLPVPKGLYILVILPEIRITTIETRQILSDQVAMGTVIQQTGNLASFVHALWLGDFHLMARCLRDEWIEPQRAAQIPGFYSVKQAALEEGALGCSISGSGPAVFAFFDNSLLAETTGQKMQQVLLDIKIKSSLYISQVNQQGATLC